MAIAQRMMLRTDAALLAIEYPKRTWREYNVQTMYETILGSLWARNDLLI